MKTTYQTPEAFILSFAANDVIALSVMALGDDPNAALDEISLGTFFE